MGANMILTMGAILLFGVFLNTSNKLMIGNNQNASQNEYYVTALSLVQSVIDEAKTKQFVLFYNKKENQNGQKRIVKTMRKLLIDRIRGVRNRVNDTRLLEPAQP